MSLIETYSDNVRLGTTSSSSGSGDLITQINPGVSVSGLGPRFKLMMNYTMNNLIYAEHSDLTRTRQQLAALGTAELVKDLIFVDGRATSSQQNVSLTGAQAVDNVNATGNRADVRAYSISPYLRHRFRDLATAELRYNYNQVSSNASALYNTQGTGYMLGLNGGTAFRTLNWGFNYSNQTVNYSSSNQNVEFERATGTLRYRVTDLFGLIATGGYEKNTFISIRGSPSAPTWTAGFVWTPNVRTHLAANVGQRFFGNTYAGIATYRTRLTAWKAEYDQNITTFNQQAQSGSLFDMGGSLNQLLTAQNPNLSPEAVQQNTGALLGPGVGGLYANPSNFFSNRLFLQKRFQASVAMNGTRNTLVLRVFNMTRLAYSPESVDAGLVSASDSSLLNNTKQSGVNGLWSYRLSPLTRANLNLAYTRFSYIGADRKDNMMYISTGLTRQLPEILPQLTGAIQIRHNQRSSNQAGSNYHENAAIASLYMSF